MCVSSVANVVCFVYPSKQPIKPQVYEVWKLENGPDLSVSASTWSDRARGCVKGFVRVVAREMDHEKLCDVKHISEHENRWNDHYGKKDKPMQKKSTAKPEHVKIRVYCIEASNLQPINKASFWDNGNSVANPFLSLRMIPDANNADSSEWRTQRGVREHDEENTALRDTINPKFASWYVYNTT